MILNPWSSCLYLPSPRILHLLCHTWFHTGIVKTIHQLVDWLSPILSSLPALQQQESVPCEPELSLPHTGGWTRPPVSEFWGYPWYQELILNMNIKLGRKQIPNYNLPDAEINESFEEVCTGSLSKTISQLQVHMSLPFARTAHQAVGYPFCSGHWEK